MALRFGLWLMVSVLVARACRWMTLSQGLEEASDPSRLGANFHLVSR